MKIDGYNIGHGAITAALVFRVLRENGYEMARTDPTHSNRSYSNFSGKMVF